MCVCVCVRVRTSQAPAAEVELCVLGWTSRLLRALMEAVPRLSHLRFGPLGLTNLTDDRLHALLQLSPHIKNLSAFKLSLHSDEQATVVWPWRAFALRELDVAQLLRLPKPAPPRDGRWRNAR